MVQMKEATTQQPAAKNTVCAKKIRQAFRVPKRSPDLNVLDYSVWSEVERRLRAQERKMPASKKETRKDFEARLNRTAKRLPPSFINKSIGDLQRRCQLLLEAKGGLFEEGGRARRPT